MSKTGVANFIDGREWLTTLEPEFLGVLSAELLGLPKGVKQPKTVYLRKFMNLKGKPPLHHCTISKGEALGSNFVIRRVPFSGQEYDDLDAYELMRVPENCGFCWLLAADEDGKPGDRLVAMRLGEIYAILLENHNNRINPTGAQWDRIRVAYHARWFEPQQCAQMYGRIQLAVGKTYLQ